MALVVELTLYRIHRFRRQRIRHKRRVDSNQAFLSSAYTLITGSKSADATFSNQQLLAALTHVSATHRICG